MKMKFIILITALVLSSSAYATNSLPVDVQLFCTASHTIQIYIGGLPYNRNYNEGVRIDSLDENDLTLMDLYEQGRNYIKGKPSLVPDENRDPRYYAKVIIESSAFSFTLGDRRLAPLLDGLVDKVVFSGHEYLDPLRGEIKGGDMGEERLNPDDSTYSHWRNMHCEGVVKRAR